MAEVPGITIERRNEILAQEVISTAELQELMRLPTLSQASTLATAIRQRSNLLHREGYIHVCDYFIYFGIDVSGRYVVAQRPRHSEAN